MERLLLNNGVQMPQIVMGTSVDDRKGNRKQLIKDMCSLIEYAVNIGVSGFDTSRDYNNESILGDVFSTLIHNKTIKREDIFITTKVGNGQQRLKDMRQQIEISLKALQLDYVDLWLLHWPLPEYYVSNWKQLCEIYKEGLVKSIGIANCRERHIIELEKADVEFLPQVVQIEYHPFRTVSQMRKFCTDREIQIEAYSANCVMLPFVRRDSILNRIAKKHKKTITQIMMRWHVQQGTIPIFSSMNKEHIKSNIDIFDFELSEEEMNEIFSLDMDYKFHPESLNCPGY